MKDLGEASYILGMKIYRDRSRRLLGLSQSTYIDTVLKRFSMENSKKGYLPIPSGITLSKKDCATTPEERERMSRIPYASAVGSIMYAMTCTRPDVAYSLGVVSRYQSDPGEAHWKVVKTILKYLRNTRDQWLIYGEPDLKLVMFTDSNFQSERDDIKSVSGYIFILNDGAICWKSSKQNTIADSVCEAEYVASADAAMKAVWLWKFLRELGVAPSLDGPVLLYCDSTGAIAQAKEPKSHHRTKHILRCYHLVREIVERGDVDLQKIDGKENLADPFVKALGVKEFDDCRWKMGIRYNTDWA